MAQQSTTKRHKQRAAHLGGSVVSFLCRSGVEASLAKGGRIQVGDQLFDIPPESVADDRARGQWVNGLIMEVAGDRLLANAEHRLGGFGDLSFRRQERVVLVERDGRVVAGLAGRSAMAVGEPVIRGNFLRPEGGHWDALAAALAHDSRPAATPSPASKTLSDSLETLEPPLVALE